MREKIVVSNISKISIKQQFTTMPIFANDGTKLFRIFQRSQLNSNSQLLFYKYIDLLCCFEYFKDLN